MRFFPSLFFCFFSLIIFINAEKIEEKDEKNNEIEKETNNFLEKIEKNQNSTTMLQEEKDEQKNEPSRLRQLLEKRQKSSKIDPKILLRAAPVQSTMTSSFEPEPEPETEPEEPMNTPVLRFLGNFYAPPVNYNGGMTLTGYNRYNSAVNLPIMAMEMILQKILLFFVRIFQNFIPEWLFRLIMPLNIQQIIYEENSATAWNNNNNYNYENHYLPAQSGSAYNYNF